MSFNAGKFDVAVVGAGHAGVEAALACARMGAKTVLFTLNLDAVANMPCNPSIGGTGKGHLVCEIDALGGQMGISADKNAMQTRMLNLGKGPAVHSLRAQIDRPAYKAYMKSVIEKQDRLFLKQAEISGIETDASGRLCAVITRNGASYEVRAAVICCGTYLSSRIITGEASVEAGPDGHKTAKLLTEDLIAHGIEMQRFKTGTPTRVHRRSIDFDKMELMPGDAGVRPFSFTNNRVVSKQCPCHITYTNTETHRLILNNLDRAPMYSGNIHGVGARYCPSIEDKVVRFADKDRHQLFIEPMGRDTQEMYVQGLSTSMPEDLQVQMLHSIAGLEHCEVMRCAYAIEYDCTVSTQLKPTLEFKNLPGLYGAGQFNGTSGYEEAAAQGLVAGMNAAASVLGREPIILDRASSYIGTMIDDLVTKGTNEPYRIMTSRAEYRLTLRQDNADFRLTPIGYRAGLITKSRYNRFLKKKAAAEAEIKRLKSVNIAPDGCVLQFLDEHGSARISTGIKLSYLIARPELSYEACAQIDPGRPVLDRFVKDYVETEIKYEGYIGRQAAEIEKFRKTENLKLPADADYESIKGLRIEARQKLTKIRPENIGQASRISGVSPADISVLLIWLELKSKNRGNT